MEQSNPMRFGDGMQASPLLSTFKRDADSGMCSASREQCSVYPSIYKRPEAAEVVLLADIPMHVPQPAPRSHCFSRQIIKNTWSVR